jgi:hypothetical protein
MRTRSLLLIALLLVFPFVGFFLVDAASSSQYLIVPGKSVGPIVLGKPIPDSAYKMLGRPTSVSPPSPGSDGLDTGSVYWENKLIVKLNDGKGDNNVFQVFVISPRFSTSKGIRRGSTFSQVRKAYPSGKKGQAMDSDFAWEIPGMSMNITNNKVDGIGVHPFKFPR